METQEERWGEEGWRFDNVLRMNDTEEEPDTSSGAQKQS